MHCTMFSTVGRYDSRVPNSPRRLAIAGAPVRAPISAATPSIAVPTAVPTAIAVTAAASDSSLPGAPSTVAAVEKPIRLTPRFIQSAKWSRKRRVRGGSVSRTSGASTRSGWSRTAVVAVESGKSLDAGAPEEEDGEAGGMADTPYAGITRTGSGGQRPLEDSPRSRGVPSTCALSAWSVQAPACQFGATG